MIAWDEQHTAEVKRAIVCRAALRLFVNFKPDPGLTSKSRFDSTLAAANAAIWMLRALLTCAVRSKGEILALDWTAEQSWIYEVYDEAYSASRYSVRAAISAAEAASAKRYYVPILVTGNDESRPKGPEPSGADAAVLAAANFDAENYQTELLNTPLWPVGEPPDSMKQAYGDLLTYFASKPNIWDFWHRWYEGVWEGTFRDWDLAIEIARIPDDVWKGKDALAQVAAEIEKIKERLGRDLPRPENVPELERKKLTEHVKRLLASPDMTALAAEGAAETLTSAIGQYLKEAPANCLPEELEHLENLPMLFLAISKTVKSCELADAKERKLANQIEALNAEVAELEAKLKDAKSKTVHGLFTQSALKAAGAAFGASLIGSAGLAVSHFFGQWPDDMTFENFRGWLSELENASPKPNDPSSLPSTLDV